MGEGEEGGEGVERGSGCAKVVLFGGIQPFVEKMVRSLYVVCGWR